MKYSNDSIITFTVILLIGNFSVKYDIPIAEIVPDKNNNNKYFIACFHIVSSLLNTNFRLSVKLTIAAINLELYVAVKIDIPRIDSSPKSK